MICYVNGQYVADSDAKISIFDRGFLFSDAVYEVTLVLDGRLVDNEGHLARLTRSLQRLNIPAPLSHEEITAIQQTLITKNDLKDASIYLQISRGSEGRRDFVYPADLEPSVVLAPQKITVHDNPLAKSGIKVMSLPETRWAHRDIKTVGLLGAVMAKATAKANGFDDAWFVEDGYVTEASSSNASIIKGNELITKKPNSQILNGITRQAIIRLAEKEGLTLVERDFTIAEAQAADEAFVTSATQLVIGVVQIDEVTIADGKVGKRTQQLRDIYIQTALGQNVSGQHTSGKTL